MKIGIFKIRTENVEKTTTALTRNRRCKQEKKVHVRSYSRLIKVHFLWASPLTVICCCCCCLFVKKLKWENMDQLGLTHSWKENNLAWSVMMNTYVSYCPGSLLLDLIQKKCIMYLVQGMDQNVHSCIIDDRNSYKCQ